VRSAKEEADENSDCSNTSTKPLALQAKDFLDEIDCISFALVRYNWNEAAFASPVVGFVALHTVNEEGAWIRASHFSSRSAQAARIAHQRGAPDPRAMRAVLEKLAVFPYLGAQLLAAAMLVGQQRLGASSCDHRQRELRAGHPSKRAVEPEHLT
jgi:hypothetical protein